MQTNLVIDSLIPVFVLMGIGVVLRRYNITTDSFLKTSDRLVYYIFFPAMLFWKIGAAEPAEAIDFTYAVVSIVTVLLAFIASIVAIRLFRVTAYRAGTFSQSCYRFNTYVGMAIILNAYGNEGVRYFGILISMAIPLINVLAVSILIWFSGRKIALRKRLVLMLKALISNPLILSCIAGIIYSQSIGEFPVFASNTFKLMTSLALPLALFSIGGDLTFKNVRAYLRVSIITTSVKLLLMPAIGYLLLTRFGVTGIPFRVSMLFFTLPTSTAIYILSSQLNSDTEMASATILISTLFSFFTMSFVLLM